MIPIKPNKQEAQVLIIGGSLAFGFFLGVFSVNYKLKETIRDQDKLILYIEQLEQENDFLSNQDF
tara:strand:+ start:2815 stop:3009 length:195 start_codon:yes stop_codon:yes gene_type:complete